ncbi:E3 ubiquitin-protein ligase E3D isoform X2 [Buteo buteo]|uniref:E3 ubiquitin-protein ligase E3D isoform X2 n=1 Tax=Buteo buteo TaxID=30397 RepID=UPI003EBC9C72
MSEADAPSSPLDVCVAADRVETRGGGGGCRAAALPAGVSLAPSSCRGLRRLPGDGLHLRMRLRRPPPSADLVFSLRESLKPQKNYVFYCQSCGDIIVKDRKFLRVLPLPSENWSALVEEWCCHPNPFARSTLHPQHGDCFLGDTFFLLNSGNESHVPESPMCSSETGHHTSQNGSNLKSKENTRVICKRCKTMLGETISSDTIKYYVTEVIIRPSEGSFSPTPRSQFLQSMVAQCLVELSSAKTMFRFTVKGDNGKIYILIWLLNSDTLLVESLGSSSSHSVFTLFGDIFMPSSGPVGTWNAVKVLYQPCIKSRNKDCPLPNIILFPVGCGHFDFQRGVLMALPSFMSSVNERSISLVPVSRTATEIWNRTKLGTHHMEPLYIYLCFGNELLIVVLWVFSVC